MKKPRKSPPPLTILAPDPRKHHDEMIDLIAKVFSFGGYYAFRDYCTQRYVDHSFYDWSASRIGLADGRIATHYGVWDYQMRVGSALLRTGGVGVVATSGDDRGKGYMARTAVASIEAMKQQGYDMTILFGIEDFYHRFGYVRAWGNEDYYVQLKDLPAGKAPRLRKTSRIDDPRISQLANDAYAGATGTAVRPTYLKLADYQKHELYVWGPGDELSGYVILSYDKAAPTRLWVSDAVGAPAEVLPAVAALARRKKKLEVRFASLHHESLIARALRQMNCRHETNLRANAGPMIRTINLRSCLVKMQDELTGRLRASRLAGWTGKLLLADSRERAMLYILRGRVLVGKGDDARHAVIGGEHIAQLLIGTDEPAETVHVGGITLTGDAPALLEVLFPAQHPMLPAFDHY